MTTQTTIGEHSGTVDARKGIARGTRVIRRRGRALVLLAGVGCSLALAAAPARARSYTIWSCRGPDGSPVGTGAWAPGVTKVGPQVLGTTSDTCATGGGLRAVLVSRATGTNGPYDLSGYRLVLPPGTTIVGWVVSMYAKTAAATQGGYGAGLMIDDASGAVGTSSLTAGCIGAAGGCTFGVVAPPLDPRDGAAKFGVPEDGATIEARCDVTAGIVSSGCTPTSKAVPEADVRLYRSALAVSDTQNPVIGPLAGSLLAPAGTTGSGSVAAEVTDVGGGVAATVLLIDGAPVQVDTAAGTCAAPYTVAAPCPSDRRASFDVSGLAVGTHGVALRTVDAAGNAVDSAPIGVTVRAPVALSTAVLHLAAARVKLSHGTQAIRGTLRRRRGPALAGVRIAVGQRAIGASTARFRRVLVVRTSRSGRFSFPAGARSRELRLSALMANPPAPAPAVLYAPLRVTLRASRATIRNGRPVTLRGWISGTGLGTRGRLVLVQVVTRHRWTTVGSVRAAATGALRWHYRFTRSRRPADYRFRFLAPVNPGEPWRTQASGRVIVRVRP